MSQLKEINWQKKLKREEKVVLGIGYALMLSGFIIRGIIGVIAVKWETAAHWIPVVFIPLLILEVIGLAVFIIGVVEDFRKNIHNVLAHCRGKDGSAIVEQISDLLCQDIDQWTLEMKETYAYELTAVWVEPQDKTSYVFGSGRVFGESRHKVGDVIKVRVSRFGAYLYLTTTCH